MFVFIISKSSLHEMTLSQDNTPGQLSLFRQWISQSAAHIKLPTVGSHGLELIFQETVSNIISNSVGI